ncbi:MAG TPA: hypothetical protein VNE39_12755 [Planctomycetota bacterium]|nr:hypothetical protein [Planctomycetota bacterium]
MSEKRKQRDEDAQAILDRRRFLIESTLAGATLGALAAGCDTDPQACLTPPRPPKPKTAGEPPPPPKPTTSATPQPCLEVAPPPKPKTGTAPQPCLSMPAPKVCVRMAPKPKVCLSLEEVK